MNTSFDEHVNENTQFNPKLKRQAIEAAVEQIKKDIENQDVEAIEELLGFIPMKNLVYYLPEEEWIKFYKDIYPHVYQLSNLVQKRNK
jgi:hypothetical protein